VKFIGSGWQLSDRDATVLVQVRPRETVELALEVEPIDPGHVVSVDDRQAREQHLARWRAVMTRIDCPAAGEAAAVLRSAITDFASLASLEGAADEWLTCQAGMPLYPALFGRDALTGGWQAAILDRGASLDASLTFFGRLQAARVDDWRDAEPGRIPHSVRRGPLARANLNPYACYYGDFAGPLMFVISLAHLYAWTGDLAIVRRHWDSARRVLEWARTRGDRDRDGYLEYETRSRLGTRNQGWKDSGDAVVYDDGSAVPTPIATCELQGYWFAAQQLMAVMSVPMGQFGEARALWRSAMALKARFNRDWWVEEAGSIAFAMDPDKTLVRVGTSNVGHCVASGIIDDMHLPRVVGRLFAPDLFSGWGIRTLSSEHRFYDPLSYHRGSVWPVEQSTIAFGLRRFGFDSRAHDLAQAMFDLAGLYPGYRVPECIGGYPRRPASAPAAYPRANAPQLWNVCAYPLLVHTLLGLQPVAPLDLLVVDPALPSWLPEVVLHDLRLAGATATLRFWRSAEGSSHVEILKKRGTLRIVKQPPPESLSAGLRDRMTALVDTVMH
jgi:glycogen debranching enzyme